MRGKPEFESCNNQKTSVKKLLDYVVFFFVIKFSFFPSHNICYSYQVFFALSNLFAVMCSMYNIVFNIIYIKKKSKKIAI